MPGALFSVQKKILSLVCHNMNVGQNLRRCKELLIVTTSGSVYHVKERKKRVVCKRRDMDRPYKPFWRKPTVLAVG